jgi:hypothetical protein
MHIPPLLLLIGETWVFYTGPCLRAISTFNKCDQCNNIREVTVKMLLCIIGICIIVYLVGLIPHIALIILGAFAIIMLHDLVTNKK